MGDRPPGPQPRHTSLPGQQVARTRPGGSEGKAVRAACGEGPRTSGPGEGGSAPRELFPGGAGPPAAAPPISAAAGGARGARRRRGGRWSRPAKDGAGGKPRGHWFRPEEVEGPPRAPGKEGVRAEEGRGRRGEGRAKSRAPERAAVAGGRPRPRLGVRLWEGHPARRGRASGVRERMEPGPGRPAPRRARSGAWRPGLRTSDAGSWPGCEDSGSPGRGRLDHRAVGPLLRSAARLRVGRGTPLGTGWACPLGLPGWKERRGQPSPGSWSAPWEGSESRQDCDSLGRVGVPDRVLTSDWAEGELSALGSGQASWAQLDRVWLCE